MMDASRRSWSCGPTKERIRSTQSSELEPRLFSTTASLNRPSRLSNDGKYLILSRHFDGSSYRST